MKTEIDWSKAPDDATLWDLDDCLPKSAFMKVEDGELFYFWAPTKDWTSYGRFDSYPPERFAVRPKAVLAPWNGEGLPPVGCRCELNRFSDAPESQWAPVEILAHYSAPGLTQPVAVFIPLSPIPHADQATAKCFRPIRTAEQLAAETRKAALNDLVRLIEGADAADKTIAEVIYDAGYRKFEIVEDK